MGLKQLPEKDFSPSLFITLNKSTNPDHEDSFNEDLSQNKFKHVFYPIPEKDRNTYLEKLGDDSINKIFSYIDKTLNSGEDVFIHCSKGEHRSASILTLYFATRAKCRFEDAREYINSFRSGN
ncbi:MAG: hypothetical protein CMO81_00505 [Waddliaceae bacterium]|nr:hypothetical protein [Waddliaceae bacterium]|tara:strand:+ start:212 stop:580 length:369 start_codon:yes stop_codon:yes gene_type:complete